MKGIYLAVLLTVFTYVFLATGIEGPHCFHFTWPGPSISENEIDCGDPDDDDDDGDKPFKHTPCIKPLLFQTTKPNLTDMWKNNEIKEDRMKQMDDGSVCVKFTYMYNGAVINVSYFRGKVTEVLPVTSGCYVQYTEGYNIEVCACKSKNNSMPCNSTVRNTHSLLIISVATVVSLFMYKIFVIP
ncbi:uncharacterized protein LOC112468670 [Temnothorax curvispinosus]|uniref:Uncharacterized protein LOC112468670 n=1 Tax=Temnothorax curvispinosus TaxID=300111 RepID=A0A6J1RFI3_9HYME|nr:uncharacterized protein LOC112468670 [Temnothorax curvispinosus]